ncbi:MAG TPA: hypothetical protein VMJ35_10190 [Dongiaceae bacterium]|nr:hypothetical protein [Dongiaceae bacterium]
MPIITCPRCGSPVSFRRAFNISSKPFCARCGWNLDRAEATLNAKSSLVTFLPLGIFAALFFFVTFAGRSNSRGNPAILLFILPLFLLIGVIPIIGYYSTKKAIAAAKMTINPDFASAHPPLDPQLQILQSLPRPRRVRIRFTGALAPAVIIFAAIAIINAGIFIAISRAPRHDNPLSFTPFIPLSFVMGVFGLVVLVPFFRDKRNLPLLRDGELAFARVLSQKTISQGKTSYSSIDYQFKTTDGLQILSTARDLSNSIFEDMTIPVFYDPTNPDRNVTPSATYFKIVTTP